MIYGNYDNIPCSKFAEVSLWLQGIYSQPKKYSSSKKKGLQDAGDIIETHYKQKK